MQRNDTYHTILRSIEAQDERVWRLADFRQLPFTAVAKAFSRLAKTGYLQRLSKGIYYRGQPTLTGSSRPDQAELQQLAAEKSPTYPAGKSAAHLLGFCDEPERQEISTSATSLPRKLIGSEAKIYCSRPAAWSRLKPKEAAFLEFLRDRGSTSSLSPAHTITRLVAELSEPGLFEALAAVAASEPPRVRALLGAIGQQLDKAPELLNTLRSSLNPSTSFDFGALQHLRFAPHWQARTPREGSTP